MSDTHDNQNADATQGKDAKRATDDTQAADDIHGADELPVGAGGDEFGRALRDARLTAGLSVGDVANALKVSDRTIDAIEAERYEDLPPRPYVRGYVQRYARLVGLDEDAVTVGSATVAGAVSVVPAIVPRSRWALFADFARQSWGLVYGSMVLVFVILIGGALWWAWPGGNSNPTFDAAPNGLATDPPTATDDSPTRPLADDPPLRDAAVEAVPPPLSNTDSPAVPPELPEPAPVDPIAPASGAAQPDVDDPGTNAVDTGDAEAAGPDLISFAFVEECWVEVHDHDGDPLHGDLGRDGDILTLAGTAPFSVLVGNPSGVEITFNGEPVAVNPSAPGEVARIVVGP